MVRHMPVGEAKISGSDVLHNSEFRLVLNIKVGPVTSAGCSFLDKRVFLISTKQFDVAQEEMEIRRP
jgi:hypothetical protein